MSIGYSTGVMFGTVAKRGPGHDLLEARLRVSESDRVDLGKGVKIGRHGSSWTGSFEYCLIFGKEHSAPSDGGCAGPILPVETDHEKVREAIRVLGLRDSDFGGIGYYLTMDVS